MKVQVYQKKLDKETFKKALLFLILPFYGEEKLLLE